MRYHIYRQIQQFTEEVLTMLKLKDMNDRQRRVFESVNNGWFMGGKYRALLDDQERMFWADSPAILFNDVDKWVASQEELQDSRLLVKCVAAL